MCLPLILTTAVSEMAHLAVLPPRALAPACRSSRVAPHNNNFRRKNSAAHAAPFSPESNRRRHVFFFLPLLFIVINGDVYSGSALAVCTIYSTNNRNQNAAWNHLNLKRLNQCDQSKFALVFCRLC